MNYCINFIAFFITLHQLSKKPGISKVSGLCCLLDDLGSCCEGALHALRVLQSEHLEDAVTDLVHIA